MPRLFEPREDDGNDDELLLVQRERHRPVPHPPRFRDRRPPFAQQMQAAAEIARAARQFNENALAVGLQLSTAET